MKQKYRKGVGIFLINKKNQLWVGKRFDYKNEYWQMPQGGIDGTESPEKAMRRELMEETGLEENYKIIRVVNSNFQSYFVRAQKSIYQLPKYTRQPCRDWELMFKLN